MNAYFEPEGYLAFHEEVAKRGIKKREALMDAIKLWLKTPETKKES
jgi:hypothetical protein